MNSIKKASALSSPLAASAAAVIGRFLLLGTGALTGVLLPLCMKQETVGLFFLTQSLIAALATLGLLGLGITGPACISQAIGQKDQGLVRQIIRRTLGLGIFASVTLGLIFIVTMFILSRYSSSNLLIALQGFSYLLCASMLLAVIITLLTEQHRAIGNFVQASFLATGSSLATASCVFLAWQYHAELNLEELIFAGIFGAFIGVLLGTSTLFRWLMQYRLTPIIELSFKDILIQTKPNLTTTAVFFAVAQADLWIIAYFGTSSDLAVYGLASRLASLVLIPLAVVNTVIAPSIGKIWIRKKNRYLQYVLGIGAGAATLLAIIGYMLFLVTGKSILSYIWSSNYSNSYYIFGILGLSQVIQTYAGTAGFVLMMLQKQHIAKNISVGSGILMIIGGSFAMYNNGIIGLSIIYSVGGIVQSILMIVYVKYIFQLDTTANYRSLAGFLKRYLIKGSNK